MSDHRELKKAAEDCGPLPWRLIECGATRLGVRDDHGYIAFMDIGHPAKYGPCPDREAKARFIGRATPAAVLELIAELGQLRAEVDSLTREADRQYTTIEAYRKDAERYRWLCDGNGYFMEEMGLCGHSNEKANADEEIDEAMSEVKP